MHEIESQVAKVEQDLLGPKSERTEVLPHEREGEAETEEENARRIAEAQCKRRERARGPRVKGRPAARALIRTCRCTTTNPCALIALLRENSLFFGNLPSGGLWAGSPSLLAGATANGDEPVEWIRDVLLRVCNDRTNDALDAKLPDHGAPAT